MKKIILTCLVVLMAMSGMAADMPKQGFGIQIGWAQPILRVNDNTHRDTLNHVEKLNGFKVGVVYDGSFIAGFGTSIGLNYTFGAKNGGWKSENPNYNVYPKSRRFITYQELELFVDWQYKFEIAKETYLMLYTGPTIQCGLTFTMRQDLQDENVATGEITTTYGVKNSAYKTDVNDEALKRFNVTWGVGAGFQYKRYFLRGGYDFGLINPYKNVDFVNGNHTRGRLDQWNIKIGMYLFYSE
ncbi:MAG: outer membrane beta-barrel protein [Paludibacteraceae bacterium]|nr:outer membrane beta-barrel protein [Paludibacteraceae bacterium]